MLNHDMVVMTWIVQKIEYRAAATGFRIGCSEYNPLDAGMHQGHGTHGTGFERHIQGGIQQTVIAEFLASSA